MSHKIIVRPAELLHSFCSFCEEEELPSGFPVPIPDINLGDTVRDTYTRRANNTQLIRASNVAKPIVWHYLNAHGVLKPERLTVSTYRKFLRGHIEEAETIALLRSFIKFFSYEAELTDTQTTTRTYGVEGHCDFVLRTPLGSMVIDVKTASTLSYDRWARRDYNDDYGYISQLGLYQEALGTDDAALLISHKEKQTYQLRIIPDEELVSSRERSSLIIHNVEYFVREHSDNVVAGLTDLLERDMLPPMVESMYRKKGTGKFKPHPTIAYDSVKYLLYNMYEEGTGKDKKEYAASVVQRHEIENRFYDWLTHPTGVIYA